MPGIIEIKGNRLVRRYAGQTTIVEPWGRDSLRVRAFMQDGSEGEDFALTEPVHNGECEVKQWTEQQHVVSNMPGARLVEAQCGSITHGKIKATFLANGKLVFTNDKGKLLLEEFARNRLDGTSPDLSALEIEGREFKAINGGDYALTARFEPNAGEHIYGMGQYQQPYLNLKGCMLELAQRNSQASVPFMVSDRGYGFLWNNPAVGYVNFASNLTTWHARCTQKLDYWITAGDSIAACEENYAAVTGKVPMMPDFAMGFWQCKLRYTTQEELLSVAREYKKRGLPLDVIVVDFFHWPHQGDWCFDPLYWPDPKAMVAELKSMGVELMVSIWPTVEQASVNYEALRDRGLLVRTERNLQNTMDFMAHTIAYDATNPEARKFVFDVVEKNYCKYGIKVFWLDEAEPEMAVYDFDSVRYHSGKCLSTGNRYPVCYAQGFYEGLTGRGEKKVLNLLRCAWAGSQKYGALVWSGDIAATFKALRNQIAAGLNMGLAGIPWWTTDIGGFHGGDCNDEAYREVFARWFEWGTFCPVMRVHGDRLPRQPMVGNTASSRCCSGGPNEVWAYGERVYKLCCEHLSLRKKLKPYIEQIMQEAHEKGTPVIRPLFYDFEQDRRTFEVEDCHMFGPSLLICPVYEAGVRERKVYLPAGATWRNIYTGEVFEGGQEITAAAPYEHIPVFARDGFDLI